MEADALSKIDWDRVKERAENCDSVDIIVVKAILAGCTIQKPFYDSYVGYLSDDKTLQAELVNPGYVSLNKMLHEDVP